MDEWMEGRKEEGVIDTDGWVDRWMNGWMEGRGSNRHRWMGG